MIDINETVEKLKEHYNKSLIHLAWLVRPNGEGKEAVRHLIFGMVECYPNELRDTLTLPEQGKEFKGGRVYYIRIEKPMDKAIEWYRSIEQNGYIIADWDKDKKIHCETMQDVKVWPNFVLSQKNMTMAIHL